MPYDRKVKIGWRTKKANVTQQHLRRFSKKKAALITFGFVPESLRQKETEPLTRQLVDVTTGGRQHAFGVVHKVLVSERSEMDHTKMTQLWKALFYSYWMCDGVRKQHQMARQLGNYIKECYSPSVSMEYIRCFWECMEREWNGIDHLRMDKFQSLVRYFVHSTFDFLASNEWHYGTVCEYTSILRHGIDLVNSKNRGLFLHLADVYIAELVNVCRVDADEWQKQRFRPAVTFDALYSLLAPFTAIYVDTSDMRRRQIIIRKIYAPLLDSMDFDAQKEEDNLTKVGRHDLDLYNSAFLRHQHNAARRRMMLRERKRVRHEIRQKKLRELVRKKLMDPTKRNGEMGNVTEKELSAFLMEDEHLKRQVASWCERDTEKKKTFFGEGGEGEVDSGHHGTLRPGDEGEEGEERAIDKDEIAKQKMRSRLSKRYTLDCVGKKNGPLRKTWNMKCGVALYSMAARNIDPLNPKRMRLRRKPLFFDKKNYNISLPFKEKILGDKFRENELMEKYGEEMERRVLDPLLMEDKMRKFQRVFYQLSQSPETPKKAVKSVQKLQQLFEFQQTNEFGYNRWAVRQAIRHADDRHIKRKWELARRRKRKMNARIQRKIKSQSKLMRELRWNKTKAAESTKLLARASGLERWLQK